MKINKWAIVSLGVVAMLSSCADDFDTSDFSATKPGGNEDYEYLAAYKPLKENLADAKTNIGAMITSSKEIESFANNEMIYTLVSSNFTEVSTPFQMSTYVNDKGVMDFGFVPAFVNTAVKGGINLYGSSLSGNEKQANKWLGKLLADKQKPVDPNDIQETFTEYPKRCIMVESDDMVEAAWDTQLWIKTSNPLTAGASYEFSAEVYAWHEAAPGTQLHNDPGQYVHWGAIGNVSFTEEWNTVNLTGTIAAEGAGTYTIAFNLNDYASANAYFLSNISLKIDGVEQVANGNMASDDNSAFFKKEKRGDIVSCPIRDTYIKREMQAGVPTEYVEEFTEVAKRCIMVETDDMVEAAWDSQLWIKTSSPMHGGDAFEFSADVYAWFEASPGTQLHNDPGQYVHWGAIGNVNFTEEWNTVNLTGSIAAEGEGTYTIAFNLNDFAKANTYFLSNISFKLNGTEMVANGKMTSDDNSAFFKKEKRGDIVSCEIRDTYIKRELKEVPKTEEIRVNKRCIIVETADLVDQAWDSQFWIQTNAPFHAGDTYEFKAEMRADLDAAPGTQIHKGSAGGYIHWAAIGNPQFSTEWETVTATGTIPSEGEGGDFIAWNLNDFAGANKYYFASISFKINGVEMLNNPDLKSDDISSFWKKEKRGETVHAPISDGYTIIQEVKNTIPLTDEEKHDTLVWAAKEYLAAVMEAADSKITNWALLSEVINESGALRHAADGDETGFYWQDYFGDEDYAPLVSKLAKEAYVNSKEGNNANSLVFFVEESNLQNSAKLQGLLNQVKAWNAKGADIKGIAAKLNVSYNLDKNKQAEQEKAIAAMFEAVKSAGLLFRVSELSVNIVDANNENVTKITFEQEKAVADFYQKIVAGYMSLPADKRAGITQSALFDTKKDDDVVPTGLWYSDYSRKPAYAGWAEALGAAK